MWHFLFSERDSSVAAMMGIGFLGFWIRGLVDRWTGEEK